MSRDSFWALVDAAAAANPDDPGAALRALLLDLPPDDLVAFQRHFDELHAAAYRWDLWAAAYVIGGGCSDDGFLDFRNGLIARGRAVHDAALADPDSLAAVDGELEDELYGYVASQVLEERGIEEPERGPRQPPEPAGEDFDFDDEEELRRRLPRLYARYGASQPGTWEEAPEDPGKPGGAGPGLEPTWLNAFGLAAVWQAAPLLALAASISFAPLGVLLALILTIGAGIPWLAGRHHRSRRVRLAALAVPFLVLVVLNAVADDPAAPPSTDSSWSPADPMPYLRSHPPRLLGEHATEAPPALASHLIAQYGDHTTTFAPVCACGGRVFAVTTDAVTRRATTRCPGCDDEQLLFDPDAHGYDGELGIYADLPAAPDAQQLLHTCSSCGGSELELALGFQYSGETDVLSGPNAPDVAPEDLFGWLAVLGRCTSCGTLGALFEHECA